MCEDTNSNGAAEVPGATPAVSQAESQLAQEVAQLRQAVERIDAELVALRDVPARQVAVADAVERLDADLVALRMDRRKVVLEELAHLENPLVKGGRIAQRTRPPRHRGGETA